MKHLFKPFIVLLLVSFFVAGCKKDEKTVKSYFNYNGTDFVLSKGFLENYGKSGTEGYNIDLTLLSSNFTIHDKSGEVDSVTGAGDALYFEIFTSHADKLDVKDYTYDVTESGADGTFDYGMIRMGFNMETLTGSAFNISGGKVSVTSVGSEYEITFTGNATNSKTITGYYKGPLTYYNYNTKKKSVQRFTPR